MLMKRLFLTLLTVFLSINVFAQKQRIGRQEAMEKAQLFLQQASHARRAKGVTSTSRRLIDVDPKRLLGKEVSDELYIFNVENNNGFVIVGGDERIPSVLGYSDKGALEPGNIPSNMRQWLLGYVREVEAFAKADPASLPSSNLDVVHRTKKAAEVFPEEVAPLLRDIAWNQGDPYNRMTPLIQGSRTLTGCVATAMAQVMYYHRWPEHGTGSFSYEDTGSGQTLTANFSEHTYNWDAMSAQYYEDTSRESGDAVALLMSDAGISVRMNYSLTFSSSFLDDVVSAMRDHFSYDSAISYARRGNFSQTAWIKKIKHELAAGRPVLYAGSVPGEGSGHAFVCDGYNADDYYHFNWGWSGSGNGWFMLSAMNPNGGKGYTEDHEMVYQIGVPGKVDVSEEDSFTWSYDASTATLHCSGSGDMPVLGNLPEEMPWHLYQHEIKHIVVDKGITRISASAFRELSQLVTVSLPEGLEVIDGEAFFGSPIKTIELPQSLITISAYAFRSTALEYVTLGPNVQYAYRPFVDIPTLKGISVNENNPYLASYAGALYDKTLNTLICYPAAANITFPDGIKTVGLSAFMGCLQSEIVLPDQITQMEDYVFYETSALRKVVLPDKLLELPASCFGLCNNLQEVVFGRKLTKINGWAFYNCEKLRSITLHRNVAYIGESAFSCCYSLNQITCYAQVAPSIYDNSFLGIPTEGVLTVPEGSDYSSWLEVLGPGWTVSYTTPEELESNEPWSDKVWASYVNDEAFWMDNPLAPMYTYYYNEEYAPIRNWYETTVQECAIRIDNKANQLSRLLNLNNRKLYGVSIMESDRLLSSGKMWISTKLPNTPEDADILVMDIGAGGASRDWRNIMLDEPILLPDGPCYVGFTFIPTDNYMVNWPFRCQSLAMADAFDGDCYVRNSQNDLGWTNSLNDNLFHHCIPAIRICTEGDFLENDAAPLSAMDVPMLPGKNSSTTISMLNLGNAPSVNSVGVRLFDSAKQSWGEMQTVNIKPALGNNTFSNRFWAEVPVPAKSAVGCYVDSVAIVQINGYPCQHGHIAVPMTVNVLSEELKHTYLVEVDEITRNGLVPRSEVGRRLLEQTMGDEVITYTNHWGDHLFGYDKYPPYDEPGVVLDGRYQYKVDPYYGDGKAGFGLADYIRKQTTIPSVAEISTVAAWRDDTHTSIRFNSTVRTLVDLDANRLSVRYIVVADGLHGTGDKWLVQNNLSGQVTDDSNLQPLTKLPGAVADYVFDAVSVFCPWQVKDMDADYEKLMYVPQMKAGTTIELEHLSQADDFYHPALFNPAEYGLDLSRMQVIAAIEDNLTKRIVNCVRVDLPSTPVVKADYITKIKSSEGGKIQIGNEVGDEIIVKSVLGEHLTFTAIPSEGYSFWYWATRNNGAYSYDNPVDYEVKEANSLTAMFAKIECRLDLVVDEGGMVTGDASEWNYYGDTIVLTATPKQGYIFKGWVDGKGNTYPESTISFTIKDYVWLRACFEPVPVAFKLTYIVDGQVYSETLVDEGTCITEADAPTKEGYTFYRWEGTPENHIMPSHDIAMTAIYAIRGDVNLDEKVNITDAVDIVNDRLGFESTGFVGVLSDVNRDDLHTIADAISVLNIMYGEPAGSMGAKRLNTQEESLALSMTDNGTLALGMNSQNAYSAFQFDVELPYGTTIGGISLNDGRCKDFAIHFNRVDNNRYRVVAYNLANRPMTSGNENLLYINIIGVDKSDEVRLTNIHFSTQKAEDVAFEDMVIDMTTDVRSNYMAGSDIEYDITGSHARKNAKGMVIVKGKKFIRK